MSQIEHSDDAGLQDAVDAALANTAYDAQLRALREQKVRIMSCLSVRTDDDGDSQPCKGSPVNLKKVGPPEQVWVKSPYIIVVDYHWWNGANAHQQQRAIFRALYSIVPIQTEKGVKYKIREPELSYFLYAAEVSLFGLDEEERAISQQALTLSASAVAANKALYAKVGGDYERE